MIAYAGIVAVLAFLFVRLPTGFLPDEDQGFVFNLITLPAGATQPAPWRWRRRWPTIISTTEKTNVDFVFAVAGFSFAGSGQNTGMAFTHLKDWSQRKGSAEQRRRHRQPRHDALLPAIATRRSLPSCRRRCRNWAMPPASTWRWKIAAIWAMPA